VDISEERKGSKEGMDLEPPPTMFPTYEILIFIQTQMLPWCRDFVMTETMDSVLLTFLAEAQQRYLNIPQHSSADDVPKFTRYDQEIDATSVISLNTSQS
jgi:hypothetical protein